ncbi:MAG: OmpA family protein [Chitinophagales bacterium]|nr:OmpA family protein [Chitinophagales bacterium]
MKLNYIFLLGVAILTISSCATSKKMKLAENLYEEGSYYNAVDYFEEVQQKKENNSNVTFKLAETNRQLNDYKQAEKWYGKTIELSEKSWPEAKFYEALMQKNQGEYDKAKDSFEKFLGDTKDAKDKDGVLAPLKRRAKIEIEGIELAKSLEGEKEEAEVDVVPGINHELQDFAPKYVDDNTVLMSAITEPRAVNREEAWDEGKDYYSKLFLSSNQNGAWSENLLPENINVDEKHNGNGVFSYDGKTLYYTQCTEDNATAMTCNIYRSKKQGNSWSDPEFLAINRKGASTTQPALGQDEDGNEVLYFASNRTGSKGGMDIFYATVGKDGELGSAVNMGNTVNTKWDDMTPHYDVTNQILYFSSEGHPGYGGLDVFKLEGNIDNWSDEVVNLGAPINSSADDLYLALNTAGSKGYLVSNRPGTTSDRGETCCDDIFKVTLKTDKYIAVKAVDTKGAVVNGVDLGLYKVMGSNEFDPMGEGVSGSNPIYFLIEEASYKVNGNKEGYWPSIETLSADEFLASEGDTILKTLVMRPIGKAVVENVYFAFDKNDIREMYQDEMDSVIVLMNKYKELNVSVEGHTDSKGSDAYNQALSERRANAAKDYLVEKGIEEARIRTSGFGESKPIAPNENPDGSDNPEGRAKNRRVEFKLVNNSAAELPIEVEYEAQEPESIE